MDEIKNARIANTMLGIEDHGILSFMLDLDYGGVHQGAGGYALDEPVFERGEFVRRRGTAVGGDLVRQILATVGVGKWEDLRGKFIRAKIANHRVCAIGNLLEDRWLDFAEFFGAE